MSSRVVVLLGAGASMDGGLPNMSTLVHQCQTDLEEHPELAGLFRQVFEALERHAARAPTAVAVDLELVLEALDTLAGREDQVLSAFVADGGWTTDAPSERLRALKAHVQRSIRRRLDVDPTRTAYLHPLIHMAQELGGLDVFTLNYDAAIEVACQQVGLAYTDGFDVTWNPALLLQEERYKVRLHKLHGSLLWYSAAGVGLTKIPLRPSGFEFDGMHIVGSPLEQVMIYPGPGKALYAEPYADLIERFRNCLRETGVIAVMGCSLRDAHIRRAILEAMAANQRLRLVLVDPAGAALLRTSDQLFGGSLGFHSFSERIIVYEDTMAVAARRRLLLESATTLAALEGNEAALQAARRPGVLAQEVAAARSVLLSAVAADAWSSIVRRCRDGGDLAFAGALAQILRDPNSFPNGTPLVLAVLAVFSEDVELRTLARAVVEQQMRMVCRYGWHRESELIHTEEVKPHNMGIKEHEVPRVLADALAGLSLLEGRLTRFSMSARHALPKEAFSVALVLLQRVRSVLAYIRRVQSRPRMLKFPGHDGSYEVEVPVADGEAHVELGRQLRRGAGFLPHTSEELETVILDEAWRASP